MSKTWQREPSVTKENLPNNQQSYSFCEKTDKAQCELSIGKDYSNINVMGEENGIDEASIETGVEYEPLPDNYMTSSEDQDADSGEPIKKQIIRLDFTPVEGVDDNDDVYKKCQGFWEFLKEHTELHPFKVIPDKNLAFEAESLPSEDIQLKQQHKVANQIHPQEMTAMDWVKREGIVNNAIRALEQKRYCELPQKDYCEARESEQKEKLAARHRRSRIDSFKIKPPTQFISKAATRMTSRTKTSTTGAHQPPLYDVDDLVAQMEDWDLKHPRNLDAPSFPFALSQMRLINFGSGPPTPKVDACCVLPCVPDCPCPCPSEACTASKHASFSM